MLWATPANKQRTCQISDLFWMHRAGQVISIFFQTEQVRFAVQDLTAHCLLQSWSTQTTLVLWRRNRCARIVEGFASLLTNLFHPAAAASMATGTHLPGLVESLSIPAIYVRQLRSFQLSSDNNRFRLVKLELFVDLHFCNLSVSVCLVNFSSQHWKLGSRNLEHRQKASLAPPATTCTWTCITLPTSFNKTRVCAWAFKQTFRGSHKPLQTIPSSNIPNAFQLPWALQSIKQPQSSPPMWGWSPTMTKLMPDEHWSGELLPESCEAKRLP